MDEEEPPFAFVLIEGTARISERDPDLRYWTTRIAGRYMGEKLAGSYGERNSVEGELLLRVAPDKIVARKISPGKRGRAFRPSWTVAIGTVSWEGE